MNFNQDEKDLILEALGQRIDSHLKHNQTAQRILEKMQMEDDAEGIAYCEKRIADRKVKEDALIDLWIKVNKTEPDEPDEGERFFGLVYTEAGDIHGTNGLETDLLDGDWMGWLSETDKNKVKHFTATASIGDTLFVAGQLVVRQNRYENIACNCCD